ncbi:MAG: helix-turn-helix transcriptional regulator [Paludibacter sp.]|nr:helix-turn-helix transcriptional regulator [Paludibacter sp.]
MNSRIEELRNTLGLSQDKFGEALGVTRTAVCAWENGRRGISEQTIISICREFNVNRAWLVEGVGEMFTNLPDTILDELAMQFDLSEEERELVADFCNLSKEQRFVIMGFLRGAK